MTPEDAFIQAILESPEDDTPRLVLADWLEDNGQAERAEFIRLQIELARLAPDDSRRGGLEDRWRGLMDAHREDWVRAVGMPLTWENELAVFRWRLEQATAWCRGRGVPDLRTPALEPAPLCGWEATVPGQPARWVMPPRDERSGIVNALANRRAKLLAGSGRGVWDRDGGLASGRLLLFDPEGTLSDEAAVPESDGYFDGNNAPAWDTWVWYAEEPGEHQGGWVMWSSYLVAWVPDRVVGLGDGGIRVNPEECIRWADDVDTALTRRLRAAGLLV